MPPCRKKELINVNPKYRVNSAGINPKLAIADSRFLKAMTLTKVIAAASDHVAMGLCLSGV